MGTGFRGTFVISWSQTEIDGLKAAPVQSLSVGSSWTWRGEAVRVDGPSELLRLDEDDANVNNRRRAARIVRRLVGAAITGNRDLDKIEVKSPLVDQAIVVTDGAHTYTITLIEVGQGATPLLMFLDQIPPRNTDLWVVHHTIDVNAMNPLGPASGGVICFTPGTMIRTPTGLLPVEMLQEGDKVQTKDNGPQEILWIGTRRMTGARLFAMPKLRPVRIRPAALGRGQPDAELLVSPEHRMLLEGPEAVALFNTPEVLVAAKDMVNGSSVTVDHLLREVTYIHLLLPAHQILWANGIETESFHPANASLSTLGDDDRQRLLKQFPTLEYDPHSFGNYARRNLNTSEAAILLHDVA